MARNDSQKRNRALLKSRNLLKECACLDGIAQREKWRDKLELGLPSPPIPPLPQWVQCREMHQHPQKPSLFLNSSWCNQAHASQPDQPEKKKKNRTELPALDLLTNKSLLRDERIKAAGIWCHQHHSSGFLQNPSPKPFSSICISPPDYQTVGTRVKAVAWNLRSKKLVHSSPALMKICEELQVTADL